MERYFEKDRAQGDLFFEIAVDGKTVRVRAGDAGAAGKETTYPHPTPDAANKDAESRIKAKVKDGFVELTGPVVWVLGKGKKPMRKRVPLDATRVNLSIYNAPQTEIDLRPLAKTNIEELDISSHALKSIDLAALAACKQLSSLYLSRVGIDRIDLSPLVKCKSLGSLTVRDQKAVDLTQLAGSSIDTLSLMGGAFKTLDLAPLARLAKLETLHIQQNPKLASLDVSPIASHPALKLITLDGPCTVTGTCKAELRRFT